MTTEFDKREHIIACRRLPEAIDSSVLQREVSNIPSAEWDNQRAPVHRETTSVFLKGYPPLLQIKGDPERLLLQSCPYIRKLIYDLLPGQPGKCLLASIRPLGIVYPHTDAANEYFTRSYRVHIPVFTNPDVRVYCNGRFFHMRVGEIWLINNLAPHAVINDHPDGSRIHLIFDIFPEYQTIEQIDRLPEEAGMLDAALLAKLSAHKH